MVSCFVARVSLTQAGRPGMSPQRGAYPLKQLQTDLQRQRERSPQQARDALSQQTPQQASSPRRAAPQAPQAPQPATSWASQQGQFAYGERPVASLLATDARRATAAPRGKSPSPTPPRFLLPALRFDRHHAHACE